MVEKHTRKCLRGATFGLNRQILQGLFMAPHTVCQALKIDVFASTRFLLKTAFNKRSWTSITKKSHHFDLKYSYKTPLYLFIYLFIYLFSSQYSRINCSNKSPNKPASSSSGSSVILFASIFSISFW